MVFSSVPLYLDPPNWQQQHHQHHQQQQQLQGSGTGNDNNNNNNQHLIPPPHQVAQPGHQVAGLGAPPIRPNSMAERARLAKIPPPEAPLKCPRCDSTNTKFCYFNNYSLSQPRHFCKACRRYWTRGGALRNVPVGGGCRRNKRSSSKSSSGGGGGGGSSSKSSLSSPTAGVGVGDRHHHMDIMSNTTSMGPAMGGIPGAGGGGGMSFMQSLQNIAQLGMGNLGLTFGGSIHGAGHHNPLGGMGGLDFNPSNLLNHPPPPQPSQVQFPNLLGGFEVPGGTSGGGLYSSSSFQNEQGGGGGVVDGGENGQQVNVNIPKGSSNMMSQLAPVKMEDGPGGLSLAKQFMGISSTTTTSDNGTSSNQFWGSTIGNTPGGTSMWTDLSGLNSSSTSHLL